MYVVTNKHKHMRYILYSLPTIFKSCQTNSGYVLINHRLYHNQMRCKFYKPNLPILCCDLGNPHTRTTSPHILSPSLLIHDHTRVSYLSPIDPAEEVHTLCVCVCVCRDCISLAYQCHVILLPHCHNPTLLIKHLEHQLL